MDENTWQIIRSTIQQVKYVLISKIDKKPKIQGKQKKRGDCTPRFRS